MTFSGAGARPAIVPQTGRIRGGGCCAKLPKMLSPNPRLKLFTDSCRMVSATDAHNR